MSDEDRLCPKCDERVPSGEGVTEDYVDPTTGDVVYVYFHSDCYDLDIWEARHPYGVVVTPSGIVSMQALWPDTRN